MGPSRENGKATRSSSAVVDLIVNYLNGVAVFFVTAVLLIGLGEGLKRLFGFPDEATVVMAFIGGFTMMVFRIRRPEAWWIKRRTFLAAAAAGLRRLIGRQ